LLALRILVGKEVVTLRLVTVKRENSFIPSMIHRDSGP
jgi:hypothetical protein